MNKVIHCFLSSMFALLFACQTKDKQIIHVQPSVRYATGEGATTTIDYYPNGSIKEISEQGKLGPFGVETGIRFCFDIKGNLIKRIHFKYELPSQKSEMDILQIQEVSMYNTSGQMTKSYVLQSSYEGTPVLVGKVKKYQLK